MIGLLRGILRGTTDEKHIQVSRYGDLYVTQHLPSYTELVNAGMVWTCGAATATAAVTNLPTTTAVISLYNNEPEGGKSYVVLAVFGFNAANAAALDGWAIVHCVNDAMPTTRPTADIAVASIKGLKARQGAYGGNAIVDLAATVTDDLWKPVSTSVNTAVNSATGTALYITNQQAILPVLPPGGMYSLASTATSTSLTTRLGFVWAEIKL